MYVYIYTLRAAAFLEHRVLQVHPFASIRMAPDRRLDAESICESKTCRIDLSAADFEFCDNYNAYAVNCFRELADWLPAPTLAPTYVATVSVSQTDVQVKSLSGQVLLQFDGSRPVQFQELVRMVKFACRKLCRKLWTVITPHLTA